MNFAEIRLKNLDIILTEKYGGNKSALARDLGKKSEYISRWYTESESNRRNISNTTARKIEKIAGKPADWMDELHGIAIIDDPRIENLVALFETASEHQKQLAEMALSYQGEQRLTPADRKIADSQQLDKSGSH